MKNKINLGIIGKNFGYNVIYQSFLKNKNFRILGFSFKSANVDKIKIAKNIKIYLDWRKLILNERIDAIVIATPPRLHKNIIEFGIKHNKHIFCEKPFTRSSKEADYICKLVEKKKNLSHMVNYEFTEIDAFRFFKNKVLKKKIKINKIDLNWFVNIKKRPKYSWKEDHKTGGGIMFNYVCHAIYYLEFLFGKIISTKSNIFFGKTNNLNSDLNFQSGLSAKLRVISSFETRVKPIHKLKIACDKNIYLLKSEVNSLFNQFELIKIKKSSKKNLNKAKFLFKKKNSNIDFRVKPTFHNSKKFSTWILKNKIQKSNFFDAKRIHLIIDKILLSSKKRKKIFIN